MNVLFLTLSDFKSINEHGIYTDLMREFSKNGHSVYAISPKPMKDNEKSYVTNEDGATVLHLKSAKTTKVSNPISKGIAIVSAGQKFVSGIKKYFCDVKFDLVLYATPPITFYNAVKFVKKRDGATTYLMLKDIFPQNAVDIGLMQKSGVKGLIYKHFSKLEKKLYSVSDYIGCMSQANVDYFIKNNLQFPENRVEVMPNSIEPFDMSISKEERIKIRKEYGIPSDKTVFVYGGNLGKPQGIPFIISCLKAARDNEKAYFLIVGGGTEFSKLQDFLNTEKIDNVKLLKSLPRDVYDRMIAACDVGLIFLDYRFTIPNFPSRLLSYMQAKLPILSVTDEATDIGDVIENGNFGWKCYSNNTDEFLEKVNTAISSDKEKLGQNAYNYLMENYTSANSYNIIMKTITKS